MKCWGPAGGNTADRHVMKRDTRTKSHNNTTCSAERRKPKSCSSFHGHWRLAAPHRVQVYSRNKHVGFERDNTSNMEHFRCVFWKHISSSMCMLVTLPAEDGRRCASVLPSGLFGAFFLGCSSEQKLICWSRTEAGIYSPRVSAREVRDKHYADRQPSLIRFFSAVMDHLITEL